MMMNIMREKEIWGNSQTNEAVSTSRIHKTQQEWWAQPLIYTLQIGYEVEHLYKGYI